MIVHVNSKTLSLENVRDMRLSHFSTNEHNYRNEIQHQPTNCHLNHLACPKYINRKKYLICFMVEGSFKHQPIIHLIL